MARKTLTVVVPDEEAFGRDRKEVFVITEMPAAQAEKWGWRAFMLLQGSGATIPQDVRGMGMVGVAIVGVNVWLQGNIDPDALMPLLDEMMTCVSKIRDPKRPDVVTPIVSDDDIQEVRTRLWLRSEVLRLHTGFSPADALSALTAAVQSAPKE